MDGEGGRGSIVTIAHEYMTALKSELINVYFVYAICCTDTHLFDFSAFRSIIHV